MKSKLFWSNKLLPRIMAGLACAILLLVLVVSGAFRNSVQQKDEVKWADKNSLKEIARRSKEEGLAKVSLPGPRVEYPGMNITLDDALRDNDIVVAEVLASKSYAFSFDSIQTWHKFRIIDALSERYSTAFPTWPPVIPEPPQDLLPIGNEEFFLASGGGTVNIDGVELTLSNRLLPAFEIGKKYVLVISITPSRVALLGAGPSGVFRVHEDETLKAVNSRNYPIQAEISQRFGGKLSLLKSHVRRKASSSLKIKGTYVLAVRYGYQGKTTIFIDFFVS